LGLHAYFTFTSIPEFCVFSACQPRQTGKKGLQVRGEGAKPKERHTLDLGEKSNGKYQFHPFLHFFGGFCHWAGF